MKMRALSPLFLLSMIMTYWCLKQTLSVVSCVTSDDERDDDDNAILSDSMSMDDAGDDTEIYNVFLFLSPIHALSSSSFVSCSWWWLCSSFFFPANNHTVSTTIDRHAIMNEVLFIIGIFRARCCRQRYVLICDEAVNTIQCCSYRRPQPSSALHLKPSSEVTPGLVKEARNPDFSLCVVAASSRFFFCLR